MNGTVRFNRETTADEVVADIDLAGKRFLVTGASSGLGQETARVLAARGAQVILAVRSPAKGQAAADAIRENSPDAVLDVQQVDLASLASIRAFAERIRSSYDGLDGIVANAGVMAIDSARTSDGFEMQFGANHLGHFVLVNHLAPLLRARAPSRLVVLSSGAHRLHDVDLADPNFEHKPYDRWDAYGQSKSANALFALAFDRRHQADGVRAFTVAPGIITDTNLHHHLTQEDFAPLRLRQPEVVNLPRKRLAVGAATIVWALVHPELDGQGGRFLEDCNFSEVNPDPRLPNGVIPWVLDHDHAEKVWALSERLVGESFGDDTANSTPSKSTAPSSAAVASGLSVNRQPGTDRLRGRSLEITLETDEEVVLEFLADGTLQWKGLPGHALDKAARVRSTSSKLRRTYFSSLPCCRRRAAKRWRSFSTSPLITRSSSAHSWPRTPGHSSARPAYRSALPAAFFAVRQTCPAPRRRCRRAISSARGRFIATARPRFTSTSI